MATFNFALPQRIRPQAVGWRRTLVYGLPAPLRLSGGATSTSEVVASVFPTASKATIHPKRP